MKVSILNDDQFDEFFTLVQDMVAEADFSEANPDKHVIKMLVKYSDGVVFVAESDGKLAGFIAGMVQKYFFSLKERVTDMGFYVKPEFRGSSAAIRLIQALEQWAIKREVNDLYIGQTTAVEIEKTQRLYEHLGYRTVGFNTVKHLH